MRPVNPAWSRRLRAALPALLALPLLTACVDVQAARSIDGSREHTLSVVREQPVPWDNKVNYFVVVSRMPVCTRRHALGVGTENTQVEVYRVPSGAYIVKMGKKMYATESQTCESWGRLDNEPEGGMGEFEGIFRMQKGKFVFVQGATSE